jgi:cell division septation protein DedD
MKYVVALALLFCIPSALRAQNAEADVAKYVAMIRNGQVEPVKAEVPALLAKYPNNPGVLYLQALTTSEGAEAVRIYQSIVDNFPTSEWADDALYKVYQFYYSLGLYRTAEIKMAQLRKNYPSSPFVNAATDKETQRLADEKTDTTAAPARTPGGPAETFTLQVGAYTTAANAQRQKSFFEDLGYPVEVINRVKEGRSLFLVIVGTYGSADEAREQGAEIKKKHNVDAIVTAK